MKTLKIGDKINIFSRPDYWDSFLCNNNPLNLVYPKIGIVTDKKTIHGDKVLKIKIGKIEYGFGQNSLLQCCFLIENKEKLKCFKSKSNVKELLRSSMIELIESSNLKILKKAEIIKEIDRIIERKLKK
jgi:hypothetical protein